MINASKGFLLLWLLPALAGYAQPATEIMLCDFNGKNLELTNPVNITNHPGYDNQPGFHPTRPLLYYSSFNAEGRSDIMVYDYKKKTTTPFTQTHDREYSPTVTPDGKFISCILQRDDGAQDLVKYPIAGGDPVVLIDSLIVGYHVWVDAQRLLLFVLGEPITLREYNLATGAHKILETNVGRSLHRIPKSKDMSFVHKVSDTEWWIMRWNSVTGATTRICQTPPGREDLAWTPDGRIISSDGKELYVYEAKENKWTKVQGPEEFKSVTRLAVHSGGKLVAVVVGE